MHTCSQSWSPVAHRSDTTVGTEGTRNLTIAGPISARTARTHSGKLRPLPGGVQAPELSPGPESLHPADIPEEGDDADYKTNASC